MTTGLPAKPFTMNSFPTNSVALTDTVPSPNAQVPLLDELFSVTSTSCGLPLQTSVSVLHLLAPRAIQCPYNLIISLRGVTHAIRGSVMTEMEFCLLGPMMVRSGGEIIPVPGGKLRAALAALLLSPGRTVSAEDLVETLWGAEPPSAAQVTIRNHVMRLRKTLGAEGARITTESHGYRILYRSKTRLSG